MGGSQTRPECALFPPPCFRAELTDSHASLLRVVTYAAHGDALAARLAVEMRAAIPTQDREYPGDVGRGKGHVKGAERWASSARNVVEGALAELAQPGGERG